MQSRIRTSILALGYSFVSDTYGAFQSYFKDPNISVYTKTTVTDIAGCIQGAGHYWGPVREMYVETSRNTYFPLFLKNFLTNIEYSFPDHYLFFRDMFHRLTTHSYAFGGIQEIHMGIANEEQDITLYFLTDSFGMYQDLLKIYDPNIALELPAYLCTSRWKSWKLKIKIDAKSRYISCVVTTYNKEDSVMKNESLVQQFFPRDFEKVALFEQALTQMHIYNKEISYSLTYARLENIVYFLYPRFGGDTMS